LSVSGVFRLHRSTIRVICRAWFSGFPGVDQMLAMQNSPHRHSGSFQGQYILAQQ